MDEYKANSMKSKEERPKVDKVVTDNVSIVKKKGFSKFLSEFVGEEVGDIKTHIVSDLIIPTIKDILMDTLGILLGRGRYSSSSRTRSIGERVSYSKYYDDSRSQTTRVSPSKAFDTDEIEFSNRGDAEHVLDRLCEIIERYGVARVTDLYDLVGLSADYTAGKYGWTSLRNAKPVRTRGGGYVLDLPRALPID